MMTLGLLVACSGAPDGSVPPVGPPVEVDLSAAEPEAAEKLEGLITRATQAPDDATLRGELGLAYSINGFQLAAMESYAQAVKLAPDDPRWNYLLAVSRSKTGDLDGAIQAVEASIEIDPSYLSSHLYRGLWLLDAGDGVGAEQAFLVALELDPGNRSGLLGLSRALLKQRRADEVVEMLEAAVDDRPGDGYMYQMLGTAYRDLGELEKGKEALFKARPDSQPPRWEDPWLEDQLRFVTGYGADMLQAEALLTTGRNAEAIELFERLRLRKADDLQLLNNLSVAYRRAGQYEDSRRILETGVEMHPEYFPFHLNLSTAYAATGDADRAIEHLDRVIELNPSLAMAYQRKGRILLDQERYEEALAAYESALSYDAGNPLDFLYAGRIATDLGQCDRAIPWLETAARMQPELVPTFLALGECRARTGDFVGAETALDRVAEIAPDSQALVDRRALVEELKTAQP
jgi:tetratricopeptide (TPR) repeat protein